MESERIMRLNNFLIIFFIIVVIVTVTGCINETTYTKRFDIIEYDLTQEYFIYVDDDEYINKISWDRSGWNSASSIVKIKQSNESYVEKNVISDGAFSQTRYILYLNISENLQQHN